MRAAPSILLLAGLLLLAACSTPDTRIADNRGAFDRFPAEVQRKIRAGQVDVGFTAEMVRLALGEPARKFTRKTDKGDTEVWGYLDNRPRFSFGVGVGSGGMGSSVGGGVGVSTGGREPDEKIRVEFREGLVTAVDLMKKK